ncbi:MAG: ATP-binding response regulator [Hyphococcus sp.]
MAQQRIILADDDPIMRELAEERLRSAGYDVVSAQNGAEAFELLCEKGAHLVISDLGMPILDGFDLIKKIRADQRVTETPVIVITGSDHENAVERAFAAGATSFLAKPINWTLFSQAVMFVLRASEDQKALRLARDQAQAGEKFKDELLSVMSHELRTPLNAIIGFGQLLGEQFSKNKDAVHQEYSDYIVDSGKRLLNSISDILLASEARAGRLSIDEDDTTVDGLIENAVAMTPRAAGAPEPRERIVLRVRDGDTVIRGDAQLLSKAVSKLIDNALKFAAPNKPVIVGAASTKSGELAIVVKDVGPGIAPEKLKVILAPFTQSDGSSRRSKEGLGLGLTLVRGIAQAHDASFRLDSEPGAGTRAALLLPARRLLAPAAASRRVA